MLNFCYVIYIVKNSEITFEENKSGVTHDPIPLKTVDGWLADIYWNALKWYKLTYCSFYFTCHNSLILTIYYHYENHYDLQKRWNCLCTEMACIDRQADNLIMFQWTIILNVTKLYIASLTYKQAVHLVPTIYWNMNVTILSHIHMKLTYTTTPEGSGIYFDCFITQGKKKKKSYLFNHINISS